jgi:hypothetical protein
VPQVSLRLHLALKVPHHLSWQLRHIQYNNVGFHLRVIVYRSWFRCLLASTLISNVLSGRSRRMMVHTAEYDGMMPSICHSRQCLSAFIVLRFKCSPNTASACMEWNTPLVVVIDLNFVCNWRLMCLAPLRKPAIFPATTPACERRGSSSSAIINLLFKI